MKAFGIGVALAVLFRCLFVSVYALLMRTNWPQTWWEPFIVSALAGGAAFGLVRLNETSWRVFLQVCVGTGVAVGIYTVRLLSSSAKFHFETGFIWRGVLGNIWQWALVMGLAAGTWEVLRRGKMAASFVQVTT